MRVISHPLFKNMKKHKLIVKDNYIIDDAETKNKLKNKKQKNNLNQNNTQIIDCYIPENEQDVKDLDYICE